MNILGIGPLIALAGGAGLVVVMLLGPMFGMTVPLPPHWQGICQILGIVLIVVGLYFWLSSAILVKRAFTSHRLETSGVYHFSRNPLYSAFIVFIVPGIALVCNNLLILIPSLSMYAAFKMLIWKEEEFMHKEFGDEYQKYARMVAQLIPFVRF